MAILFTFTIPGSSYETKDGTWVDAYPEVHITRENGKYLCTQKLVNDSVETSTLSLLETLEDTPDNIAAKMLVKSAIDKKYSLEQWNHIRIDYLIAKVYGLINKRTKKYKQLYAVGEQAKPSMFYACLVKLKENRIV